MLSSILIACHANGNKFHWSFAIVYHYVFRLVSLRVEVLMWLSHAGLDPDVRHQSRLAAWMMSHLFAFWENESVLTCFLMIMGLIEKQLGESLEQLPGLWKLLSKYPLLIWTPWSRPDISRDLCWFIGSQNLGPSQLAPHLIATCWHTAPTRSCIASSSACSSVLKHCRAYTVPTLILRQFKDESTASL